MKPASPESWRLDQGQVDAIVGALHGDPFAVLGPHVVPEGVVIRAFAPHALEVEARDASGRRLATLERRHSDGVFEGLVRKRTSCPAYRLFARNDGGEWSFDDPYRFGPVLGEIDDYLLVEGAHMRLYDRLGAHPLRREEADGVHFSVWAPSTSR